LEDCWWNEKISPWIDFSTFLKNQTSLLAILSKPLLFLFFLPHCYSQTKPPKLFWRSSTNWKKNTTKNEDTHNIRKGKTKILSFCSLFTSLYSSNFFTFFFQSTFRNQQKKKLTYSLFCNSCLLNIGEKGNVRKE